MWAVEMLSVFDFGDGLLLLLLDVVGGLAQDVGLVVLEVLEVGEVVLFGFAFQ